MEDSKLHKIASRYLPKGKRSILSSARYSNWLYKIEPDVGQSLMVKVFDTEHCFVREKAAYKILNTTSVKIPNLIDVGEEGPIYWIVYDFVEGERLCDIDIRIIKDNHKLFYEIGHNLGKVHTCNPSFLFTENEKAMYLKKRQEVFVKGAWNYKENLVKKYPGYLGIFELAAQIIKDNIILFSDKQDFNFTKGDFSPNNTIINNESLAAIIDFEYFMLENRYRDFILMYHYFEQDEQIKMSFIRGYSEGINACNFEFSSDKLMLVLLHYCLECCVVANAKTIEWNIKRLTDIVEKFCRG